MFHKSKSYQCLTYTCWCAFVVVSLSHTSEFQITSLITLLLFDLERPNSAGNTCGQRAYYYSHVPIASGEGPSVPQFLGDSIMWTPFVVKRINISLLTYVGSLTVTPSSQGAVLQRSPILVSFCLCLHRSVYNDQIRLVTWKWGTCIRSALVPRLGDPNFGEQYNDIIIPGFSVLIPEM